MKLNLLLLVAEAERLKAADAAFEASRPALYAYAVQEPGRAPEAVKEFEVEPVTMYCFEM